MGHSEQNLLHSGVVRWYYNVVAGPGPGVPESVFRHFRRGLARRRQVYHLQEAVIGAGGGTDTSRSGMKRDIIDTLSLHFGCLDEQVTCSRVKPFLPGLLLPDTQIRIPTPITVHLDHCPECAEDLDVLRDLGLGAEQLRRLEQLYKRLAPIVGTAGQRWAALRLCRRAHGRIAAFTQGELDGIDREVLDHLCTCPRCRGRVHDVRQKLLEKGAAGGIGAAFLCSGDVPIARLFDYAVPYGRTTDGPARAEASHVRTCRSCLTRIQVLDETIYGIGERTNSGVATIYSTVENARPPVPKPENTEAPVNPYADYPIDIQVIHGAPEPAVARSAAAMAALQRTACNPQVRFLLKSAVTVAAVVALAILFRGTASTSSGLTLGQVFKAFERAENVHVTRFHPVTGQLVREQWISRGANLGLSAGGQECVLYDLDARKCCVYSPSGGPATITDLTEREYAQSRQYMVACLGLTLEDVPRDAKWVRQGADGDVDTYELTYSIRVSREDTDFRRWRITVDRLTGLPREVLAFRRGTSTSERNPELTIKVGYPTDEQMRAAYSVHHIPWPR